MGAYGKYNKKNLKKSKNFLLIVPPNALFEEPYKNLVKERAKVVAFSGKVKNVKKRSVFI